MPRVERFPQNELPQRITPMDMIEQRKPFDRKGWIFELKLDGYRGMARVFNGKVDLHSKRKTSFQGQFPAIESSLRKIKHNVILDGEIVIVDDEGKPNWEYIQGYRSKKQGTEAYYVFDILHLNGQDLTKLPLKERKEILKSVLPDLPNILFMNYVITDGIELFEAVKRMGLEGMVAKDPESVYRPGERTRSWIKVKHYVRHGFRKTVFR